MAARHVSVLLILSVLLAGCSLRGGESQEQVDRDEYDGGAGLAVALRNLGEGAFDVEIDVLRASGSAIEYNVTLQPGESVEKWWSLDRTTYSVRMVYHWSNDPARASTGFDDVTVDLDACPLLSRLSFTYDEADGQPGHAYEGKTCLADE